MSAESPSGALTVIVRFPAKPGSAPRVVELLRELRTHLSALPSHVHSVITLDDEAPDDVVFVESYAENREAFVTRLGGQAWFASFDVEVEGLLREPRRVSWLSAI